MAGLNYVLKDFKNPPHVFRFYKRVRFSAEGRDLLLKTRLKSMLQ